MVDLEKLGKPTAGIVTNRFVDIARANAKKKGMPNARIIFVPHPVQGMTSAQHKAYVEGKDPVTGRQVIQEIVDALTGPLTDEDKKTGFVETQATAKLIGPQTPDNLQRLFQARGWTDYLPVILPTEKKVSDMLKGTSHSPDEVVGKMAGGDYEPWQYTVEQVAVNAVMAGAKSEQFPLILAIASTGISSIDSSPDSLARAVVVNGPMRKEIGMNSEIGALGPFNQANAAVGRAWTLISKNLGNAGILGETYSGSQGNSLNYSNIVIVENEEQSPWKSLSVQRGFKPGESVVSIFTGLGIHPGQGANQGGAAKPAYNAQISSILDSFAGYFGALVVCDPLIAGSLKEAGFDTKEKLSEWLQLNTKLTVADYKESKYAAQYDASRAQKGIQPFADWFKLPGTARIPRFASPKDIEIVVLGGETLAVFQAANMKYMRSALVDEWR